MKTLFWVLAAAAAGTGCATTHASGTLGKAPPACTVKQPGLLADRVVHVQAGQATVPGLLADQIVASVDQQGVVFSHSALGRSEVARVNDGVLKIRWLGSELTTDPIQDGKVTLKGLLGSQTFEYAAACSVAEAAAGAYALFRVQNDEALMSAYDD